ncbi:ferrochelatase [Azospirillum sp. SYSU D00513]|uniref:ferrochelatase n=1 Tax=Azospirillum sp. SYSU D00513 TaxID=2812561 RepID=UPI001A95CC36|nr:ferrochelatase [Azospirillum sp. SYSU D00513]
MPIKTPPARTAVVLLGLGEPDGEEAVRPVLFNRLADPAGSRLPDPIRTMLASVLSGRRAKAARAVQAQLGGRSPLLESTELLAAALEAALEEGFGAGQGSPPRELRVFIAMRHWHPLPPDTAARVRDYGPELVVLLPLHPQHSAATTGGSVRAWREAAQTVGLEADTRLLCCHPTQAGFIDALAAAIRPRYDRALRHGRPRLLLSGQGLRARLAKQGDPFPWQCERTAESLIAALGIDDPDWVLCQHGAGREPAWLGPSTEEEIRRAGRDRVPVLVVPISFPSERIETLVEIESGQRRLAEEAGVPHFVRVPAPGADPAHVAGLARLVRRAIESGLPVCAQNGGRICPDGLAGCPQQRSR